MEFTGAVLTGGASRRMGTDKALIGVDGRAMAVRVAEALDRAGAADVVCVGGDLEALAALGLAAIAEPEPGAGPVSGIVGALNAAGSGVVVVLACDLLDPSADAIRSTVGALGPAQLAVPVSAGRRQWMHAAWRAEVSEHLRAALSRGVRAVHDAAEGLETVEVPGVPAAALADADRTGDLPTGSTLPTSMDVPEIDIDELERRRDEGATVIDVRQPDEYEEAHIPGARLIPMTDVPERVEEIPDDETVYLVCGSGPRSQRAAAWLLQQGHDAVNVTGGTQAWIEAGKPLATGTEPS